MFVKEYSVETSESTVIRSVISPIMKNCENTIKFKKNKLRNQTTEIKLQNLQQNHQI